MTTTENSRAFALTEIAQFLTDVVTAAGLLSYGCTDKKMATRISEQAHELRKHIHFLAASHVEQPAAAPTGYCERVEGCVCGDDLSRVREGCAEWVKTETRVAPADERHAATPIACPQCGGSLTTWKCTCEPIWEGYRTAPAPAADPAEIPAMVSGDYVPGKRGWMIRKDGGIVINASHDVTAAVVDVRAERRRQINEEGWTVEHDDEHACGEIASLAAFYAMPASVRDWPATDTGYGATFGQAILSAGWSAKVCDDRRRELVMAGALILTEIERLDRAAARAGGSR
ncbi:MAG: hypothetical protein VB138_14970 [Burkholderia sp.]